MGLQQVFGLGLAFFTLFLVPIALAAVAIVALLEMSVPVLIVVLVLSLIFFGVFAYLLSKFIDAAFDDHHHRHNKH